MIDELRSRLVNYPVDVTSSGNVIVVKTTEWITDKNIFREISEIIKGFGGIWIKDGKNSRFEIPLHAGHADSNPAKMHLAIIRSELDKLEAML